MVVTFITTISGMGGEVVMMLGLVVLWIVMAGKTTNTTLRTFMYIQSMLMIMANGWIVYFSFDDAIDQIWLWSWMMSVMFATWLMVYMGLWMTGNLVKGEIDNEF